MESLAEGMGQRIYHTLSEYAAVGIPTSISQPLVVYENFLIDELHLNAGDDEAWLRLTSMSFEKTSTIGRKD